MTLSPDEPSFATVYYPGVLDSKGAVGLALSGGQQIRGLNFTLRKMRLATLRGRVVAPENAMDLMVELNVRSGGTRSGISRGIRDKDGKFEFFGIPPGSFSLTGRYGWAGKDWVASRPLEVGSADISDIELRPTPNLTVEGAVTVEGESVRPVADLEFTLEGTDWNYSHEGATESDGRLVFRSVEADVSGGNALVPDERSVPQIDPLGHHRHHR